MSTRFRTLPVTGLAAVRDARTRIYTPGADPKFRAADSASPTFRLVRAFPPTAAADRATAPYWRRDLLDRLQSPVTRRPE